MSVCIINSAQTKLNDVGDFPHFFLPDAAAASEGFPVARGRENDVFHSCFCRKYCLYQLPAG